MSDLQISLIVLAVIGIGAVWLFNVLVERRRRHVFEQRLKPRGAASAPAAASSSTAAGTSWPRTDALERSEPTLGGAGGRATGDADGVASDLGPPPEAAFSTADDDEGDDAQRVVVDDAIHAVITIEPDGQVSGERALSLLHAFRHAGRQPVLLVGVRGPMHDQQELLRAGRRYDAILVAVQLANRSGPLNEIEWSEFVAALQHVSEQIPASCEIPDMRETTARARALDALCVPLDAQIGINLATLHDGWTGEVIADFARRLGLILRSDGRFHALDAEGNTLFVLQNGDGGAFRADTLGVQHTSRITLLLDVPRAPQEQRPFDRLVELANALAGSLEASIVDDQSHLLTPAALTSIGRQIDPVYAKLVEAGMPAGSPRALALFN